MALTIVNLTKWDGVFSAIPFPLAGTTTAGNALVVAVAGAFGNSIFVASITTDAGDNFPDMPFNNIPNAYGSGGGGACIFWMPSCVGGATTMTVTCDVSMDVFVYEIHSDGAITLDDANNQGSDDLAPGTIATGPTITGASLNNLYIAVTAHSQFVSVNAPWTADVPTLLPGGAGEFDLGAAHLFANGAQTPVFNVTSVDPPLSPWEVSAIVVGDNTSPPVTVLGAVPVVIPVTLTVNAAPTNPCEFCDFDFLVQNLARRLNDPGMVFWTEAELQLYIIEALRTWNALTGYWRGEFTFTPQENVRWYDMTDQVAMPNTLRPLTVTAADLFTQMQYHLLEPPVGAGSWTGSRQFALEDLQQALKRRRNECVGNTSCFITRITIPATARRTALPLNVIDVRRIAFIPSDNPTNIIPMWREDKWSMQQFDNDYTTQPAGIPTMWTITTEPFLTFDVDIFPVPGTFELLVVQLQPSGCAPDDPAATQTVPDDWTWVLKFGSLSDLFGREGEPKDDLRRSYCEMRYRTGSQLLAKAPALLAARINNLPLQIDAMRSADAYATDWESTPEGSPDTLLVTGLNLLALQPIPDDNPYSVYLQVVENALIPENPADCISLGRELFDVIIDYAQHLAMLKCGGAEFLATMAHYKRFMQQAALYASKLDQQGEYVKTLWDISQREMMFNPVYRPGTGLEAEDNNNG